MHLEITQLNKIFTTKRGAVVALKDINLHVESAEFVCAVGASGSGKSTLLRMIAGLELPTSGKITVDGVEVTGPGADRGMVFQNYTLYPWMTIQKNVEFGLKLQGLSTKECWEVACYYVVAELVAADNGLGKRILLAQKFLRTDEIFACLIVLGIIGFALDLSFRLFLHWTCKWSITR
jgi:ABC-type nitrate/sulfonate/bicarbonate transport system ATPase subunit